MVDTVEVKALVTDVKHDGTNMIVLKAGEKVPVAASSVDWLYQRGLIEDPYGDLTTGRVGGVNIPMKADGFQSTSKSADDLNQMSISALVQVAVDEGVIDDLDVFRRHLIGAISDRRSAANGDEVPAGSGLQEGEADGVEKTPIAAEPDGNGGFSGEAAIEGDGSGRRLPQLDHDGDGKAGGDLADDEIVDETAGFTLTEVGGGWWQITGPGLDEPVKVRGEDPARARYDELVAAAASADSDEAPAA